MNKTTRLDGLMVLHTKKPYKMAINGTMREANTIICKEIDSNNESASFDFEQLFDIAIMDMSGQSNKQIGKSSKAKKDEKDQQLFFDNDSPEESEIEKFGEGLEMIIRMNKSIKFSNVLETFNEFITGGLILSEDQTPITIPIWTTLHRDDKARIVFMYAAFFVNPLLRLLAIGVPTDNPSGQGVTDGLELQ